ncbi:hypothetical protein U0C82_18795 [Fulvimarina sp. 2208YS6-2-32]|uniref:Replication protein n=1 Tax=Fulvimarina uroteuthidis TaxID=3098149 RepID=A0ABU5I712_9HYPH|nr:hypothetical protein [Fulvimarina sp. 2208YS6-2-32]MDY8111169.1 hypothetical protein [Fulvimarina sp. 2208YS6-2-32]
MGERGGHCRINGVEVDAATFFAELDKLPAREPSDFVNWERPKSWSEELVEAVAAQGVEAPAKRALPAPQTHRPLVRGGTQHPTPSLTTRKRRHIADDTTASALHDALAAHGLPLHAVTVRLSAAFQRKALAQAAPLDWFRRAFNRWAKAALGFVPPAVFASGIESAGGDDFHIHALVAAADEHLKIIRQVLKLAAGVSDDPRFRERQVVIKPCRDARWTAYCLQNAEEAERKGVPGKHMITSREVQKAATAIRAHRREALKTKEAARYEVNKSTLTYQKCENICKTAEINLAERPALTHNVLSDPTTADLSLKENHNDAGSIPADASLQRVDRAVGRSGLHKHSRLDRTRRSRRDQDRPGRVRRRLARHNQRRGIGDAAPYAWTRAPIARRVRLARPHGCRRAHQAAAAKRATGPP